jgi:hypothetical protein
MVSSEVSINPDKSSIYEFSTRDDAVQHCRHVHGKQGRNGLEYLGFRFDGKKVYLRDSTITALNRRTASVAKREAARIARRYPDKDAVALKTMVDCDRVCQLFGRVQDFEEKQHDYRNWTFWTYAHRAKLSFGSIAAPIYYQLRRRKALIRMRLNLEIDRAVARRSLR